MRYDLDRVRESLICDGARQVGIEMSSGCGVVERISSDSEMASSLWLLLVSGEAEGYLLYYAEIMPSAIAEACCDNRATFAYIASAYTMVMSNKRVGGACGTQPSLPMEF